MKIWSVASALSLLLFSTALVGGKSETKLPETPDSLKITWLYTDGIKLNLIGGDTAKARAAFEKAIELDSTYAPAYYQLFALSNSPEEAVRLTEKAFRLDTTNKWYRKAWGQSLLMAERYKQAQEVFEQLCTVEPSNPDNYRVLAALYEQNGIRQMALATLDSAELRFGKIPYLSAMKRRMLIEDRQLIKAEAEAKAMIDEAPYEPQYYTELAEIYASAGKDSLARTTYLKAYAIDSTHLQTLLSLSDFYTNRRDYVALMSISRRIFALDQLPVETKIRRFEQFTGDKRFYREYYPQINDLALMLAIHYPDNKRVTELYANHLIASGELEQALALYKSHLDDEPPVEDFYRTVIDIESYLQHPDSVSRYVDRALELFPDKIDFHLSKGHVMGNLKQYDRAVKIYKEALRYAPTDSVRAVIWGMIGDVWHLKATRGEEDDTAIADRKAMSECYKAYDRSLRYDPDAPLVLNNYAYFLSVEERELEKALAMSSRVVALTDNNPTYLDTHAWVLYKLGRYAEAKKVLQQAIALDRNGSPELMVHYGDILHELGEQFLAETYWRKALDKGYDRAAIEQRIAKGKKSTE